MEIECLVRLSEAETGGMWLSELGVLGRFGGR